MQTVLPWLAAFLGLLGNCGWWLFCFNRVNAFGYPRPIAKIGEKVCITLCFLIPAGIFLSHPEAVRSWLTGDSFWPSGSMIPLQWWLGSSLLSLAVLSPLWLESRRWLKPPPNLVQVEGNLFRVHRELDGGSASDLKTRLWARVPFNEWAHLEVNRKTLRLPRKILAAEGLKIGHLSDLHFTGQYRPQHYHFVIGQLMSLQPDLIFISGDIIDFQHCMPMVDEVLKGLSAPLGCYFVLGNHERRLKHVPTLVDRLTSLGFIDLGLSSHDIQVRDLRIQMLGNESPWFNRRATAASLDAGLLEPGAGELEPSQSAGEASLLRLGVAHTPDCIGWARRHRLDLLLAGHTHGGQARFPWIGPLVAPSLHGSKFASGVFLLPPTLMHVSRGVAGTHTIRWRCPPEVSVLKLTNP